MDNYSLTEYTSSEVFNGIRRACVGLGIDPANLLIKKAAQDIIENSVELQKLYSLAGARIFERAGMSGSVEHRIFCKCASTDTLLSKEASNAYIQPVKDTLEKQAGGAVDKLLGTLSMLSNAPYLAAAVVAAAGAAGGGGVWALQRALEQGDAAVEAKYQQAKAYKDAARQIQKKMNIGANPKPQSGGTLFA